MTTYYNPPPGQDYGWIKQGPPTEKPKIASFKKTEESKKDVNLKQKNLNKVRVVHVEIFNLTSESIFVLK